MLRVTSHTLSSFDQQPLFARVWQNSAHPNKTLVFIHGLAGDNVAYELLIEELSVQLPHIRCIAYDLRGHGQSSFRFPLNGQDLYHTLALDLQAVVSFFNIKRPIFVGQSMAGMVIQKYLEEKLEPQPTAQILISSGLAMPWLGFSPTTSYARLAKASQKWKLAMRTRQLEDHTRYQGSWDYSPVRIATDIHFTHLKKYLLLWLAAMGWRAKNPYVCNQPQTLYLFGQHDVVIPPFIQHRYLKNLTAVKAHQIPSNHNAIVNHPQLLATEISAFIKQSASAQQ